MIIEIRRLPAANKENLRFKGEELQRVTNSFGTLVSDSFDLR